MHLFHPSKISFQLAHIVAVRTTRMTADGTGNVAVRTMRTTADGTGHSTKMTVTRVTDDSLLQFRKDSELGDLALRFDKSCGHFPTDDDLCCANSRLVIVDNTKCVEHVIHCGLAECSWQTT